MSISTQSRHEILSEPFMAPYGRQGNRTAMVLARCLCGGSEPRNIRVSSLKRGEVRGCRSCFQRNSAAARVRHGYVSGKDYLYFLLHGAKGRCKRDPNYSERGIRFFPSEGDSLCRATELVREKIGDRPSSLHQLDRIDNDGDYEVWNLRWATISENNFNRRTPTEIISALKAAHAAELSAKDEEIRELKKALGLITA